MAIVDLHHDITALEAELADLERSYSGGSAALERPGDPAFAARTTALAERATEQLMAVGRAEIDRQLDAVRDEASARVRRARAAAEAEVDAARARLADVLRERAATVDRALATTTDPIGVARVHVLTPPLPRLDRLEVAARLSEVARASTPQAVPASPPAHALADRPDQHELLAALVADVDRRTTAPLGTSVEGAPVPSSPAAAPVGPAPAAGEPLAVPLVPAFAESAPAPATDPVVRSTDGPATARPDTIPGVPGPVVAPSDGAVVAEPAEPAEPAEQPGEADPTDRLVALFAPDGDGEAFAERRRVRAVDALVPLVLTLVVLVAVLLVVG